MDHVKLLIPITLLLLFYRPVPVSAEIIDISQHSGIIRDSAGNYKTINGRGSITSINTGTQLQIRNPSLPVPTTKGNQFVDISRTANVDIARVGIATASMIRRLTPLAMTIGAVSLICELAAICEQAGEWWTGENSDIVTAPPGNCSFIAFGEIQYWTNTFNRTFQYKRVVHSSCEPTPAGFGVIFACSQSASSCINGEQVIQKDMGVGYPLPEQARPITDADLEAAETALSDPQMTDHLLENAEPVPVDVSTPPALDAPINQPIGSETITTKDAQGNTTGTQVTETSLDITDAATTENPNQIDVKEKKTVTTYDLNNNPTGSTTTESEIRPPAPPDPPDIDYEIDFDDVNDKDLEEYEFPDIFSYESWGEGSCPADRSVSYGYGNLNLSMQPACDFATGVRPIILVIAGLSAMFIISGIKTE